MNPGALFLAFSAGMLATVNPCGFPFLPSTLAFYLGSEGKAFRQASAGRRVAQGFSVGLVVTAGFMTVFVLVGGLISVGARAIIYAIPWLSVVIGLAMAGLGLWMLAGRALPLRLPAAPSHGGRRTLTSLFGFGVAYAVASLSCTLPIFLAVIAGALASDGLASALALFASYAAGMAAVLIPLTVGVALLRAATARLLWPLLPHVHRLSAAILLIAGLYVVYYWLGSGLLG